MSKDNDNIIKLPNSRGKVPEGPPTREIKEGTQPPRNPVGGAQPDPQEILKRIATNRQKGLSDLENKVDGFDIKRKVPYEPHIEDRFRDSEAALKAVHTNLEALNAMVDMIAHDLIGAIQNLEQNAVAQFQASAHLQVLLQVLKDGGIVTEEQLREVWDKTIAARAPTDPEDLK